jgi:hypothetical protein
MYRDIKTAKERLGKPKKASGIFGRRAGGAKADALVKKAQSKVVHKLSSEHKEYGRSIKSFMDNDSNFKD